MRRSTYFTVLLLFIFHPSVDAGVLPSSEPCGPSGTVSQALTSLNHSQSFNVSSIVAHHRIHDRSHSLPPRAALPGELDAFFDPRALPPPWPLGAANIVFSVVTGLSNYKFAVPNRTRLQTISWIVTLARSFGLGLSAILNMIMGDYVGASSDGFLALFANVSGIMAAKRDYGEARWSMAGVLGMLLGLGPHLLRITLSLRRPDLKRTYAPFRLSDGKRCIVGLSSTCKTNGRLVPGCAATIFEPDGAESVVTIVDLVRLISWLFAAILGVLGFWRLFLKKNAGIWARKTQVYITYAALVFSITLVITSAISYGKETRQQGLDCRALTECKVGRELDCPRITVVAPRSGNGFFKEWSKQVTGMDIPGVFA